MNLQQTQLYDRIQAFSFDQPNATLPFSQRLARDNGWTIDFANRAIQEYRRFTFLAIVAGHPVTPSDQVDQVWHLHLTYTQSYWNEFCPNVLQAPLHHCPTLGGDTEQDKFNRWYSKTLESYTHFFGQPPTDLWPTHSLRFGRDLHFQRLNLSQNWILPKPVLPQWQIPSFSRLHSYPQILSTRIALLIICFSLSVVITGCQILVAGGDKNPLNYNGPTFLGFYIGLIILASLIAFGLRRVLLSQIEPDPAQNYPNLNEYELAYLAGGANQAIHAVLASLLHRGHLQLSPLNQIQATHLPLEQGQPIEQEVLQAIHHSPRSESSAHQICLTAASRTKAIAHRLTRFGLLYDPQKTDKVRWLPFSIMVLVFLLGVAKILVGISRNRPTGNLTFLCFVVLAIGFFMLSVPHCTAYGDRLLQTMRGRHHSLKSSRSNPSEQQLILAFALFGSSALIGSSLNPFHELITPRQSDSSTSYNDSGSSCGGGGGCGGCSG
ncbi:TIGR04222 domain-containing membrane protein [Egbenema bharatensis]|uniref:TIGR04222 domain-containing membrane protein n=1 Tax=Egbenema bharatensis TaxID=3463334 RepID=UPI003A89D8DB